MERNREDIIKALECCTNCTQSSCDICPFEPKGDCYKGSLGCNDELMKNALALIKELAKENTRLQDLIQEVQQYNEAWVEDNGNLRKEIETVKADAVRKMQERLCEGRVSNDPVVIAVTVAAKEMLEGDIE